MIGYILAAVALIGGTLASWYDLRTTEVPDLISVVMALTGIGLHLAHSLIAGDFSFILSSLITGSSFLALGYAFYWVGLWGGADSLLFGAIGYLLPHLPTEFSPALSPLWPYQLTLVLNIFLIGSLYSIVYSLALTLRDKNVWDPVKVRFKEHKRSLILSTVLVGGSITAISLHLILSSSLKFMAVIQRSFLFFGLYIALICLYHFLKGLEENLMKRKIPVQRLEVGDVLAEDLKLESNDLSSRKIRGLNEEEVKAIKREKETVKIKSGVCFIPTFPLAVLVTLAAGDLIYLFALSL